jgi:hypothetical protein
LEELAQEVTEGGEGFVLGFGELERFTGHFCLRLRLGLRLRVGTEKARQMIALRYIVLRCIINQR